MRVLVACEFSGIVREAFKAKGHDAWSCDLLATEMPGQHLRTDVISILHDNWDMLLAFPPCTHLASSGARWFKDKQEEQKDAIQFVRYLWNCTIPKICMENPVGILSTHIRKPDQTIQPWQFGHGETKATCLWLYDLPKLIPTDIVEGREPKVHHASPGPNRWKERSRTYKGIADAMAEQWG